ncbi:hypothetical protein FO519_006555 [Halicephalobus sp. NKZ332]|nr:hypothetical protein FO519_006555 [Halicephalobus sp. NKZ332]
MASGQVKLEYYQTDDKMVITLFEKNVDESQAKVFCEPKKLKVVVGEKPILDTSLFEEVLHNEVSYIVRPKKIEITLKKKKPGTWRSLEDESFDKEQRKKTCGMTEAENPTKEKIQKSLKKFQLLADHVPVQSWGFEPEVLDLLRDERHKVVSKRFSSIQLSKLSKKEKHKFGVMMGPKANNVTEVVDWVKSTPLGKRGPPKPVDMDIKTDFEFSRLVSSKDEPPKKKKKTLNEKRDTFKGKNYKELLKKVEERTERIKKIEEKDPEKAQNLKEEIQWNRAMKRASGEKVKDNPELLKKGMKRKEKVKARSKKKWDGRVKQVEGKKEQKQVKRKENLQKAKDKRKEKKIQKAKKKGRVVIKG